MIPQAAPSPGGAARPPPPPQRNRAAIAWQALAALLVLAALATLLHNTVATLARRNIDIDFAFLLRPAGFDIPFRLVPWESTDSYGTALGVALLNTALASAVSIVVATALGLVLALMRLSANPLARLVSRGTIELVRNTPQLLQVVFWYFAVLQALPTARASLSAWGAVFLNVRGLYFPGFDPAWPALLALAVLVLPRAPRLARLAAAVALAAILATTAWTVPALRGFNFTGGWRLPPELLALVLGIAIYTAAFIAENIRASIAAIPGGQREAALSLGLSPGRAMRLVILPQALRTLVPPLTSQYLNVIKSTTLGAAIAYPEVLQVFARTVLNQSGRAVEVMVLVLGVFLLVNLLVSAAMARWERRMAGQAR